MLNMTQDIFNDFDQESHSEMYHICDLAWENNFNAGSAVLKQEYYTVKCGVLYMA